MKNDIKKEALRLLSKKMRGEIGKSKGLGVQVQAKDKKSLLKGLDKAKEVVEKEKIEEPKRSKEDIQSEIAMLEKELANLGD
jgi:hypothetical protein